MINSTFKIQHLKLGQIVFTGLIREFAKVKELSNDLLTISAKYKPKIGDSIAINGACLTVVKVSKESFSVELSHETKSLLAVENLKGRVHIEPAMALGERLEGHILQGHIDTVGVIKKIDQKNRSKDFLIEIPKEFMKFVIPKGSIAIDGVSLTINDVNDKNFRLTIIPHTLNNTLFEEYQVGRRVNIETDMFARYLYYLMRGERQEMKDEGWKDIEKILAIY
jgi:riboflavin synthase